MIVSTCSFIMVLMRMKDYINFVKLLLASHNNAQTLICVRYYCAEQSHYKSVHALKTSRSSLSATICLKNSNTFTFLK